MRTYSSNSDKIIDVVSKSLDKASVKRDIVQVASEKLVGDIGWRIWNDHNATNGNKIGVYSTKPMYASLEWNSINVRSIGAGRGKNSNSSSFKNGKPRKSKYFAGGYKEYKGAVKGVTEVNLELTGQLKSDFNWTIVKDYAVVGFRSAGSMKIAMYLEEHFNTTIFEASQEEIDLAVKSAREHVLNLLTK